MEQYGWPDRNVLLHRGDVIGRFLHAQQLARCAVCSSALLSSTTLPPESVWNSGRSCSDGHTLWPEHCRSGPKPVGTFSFVPLHATCTGLGRYTRVVNHVLESLYATKIWKIWKINHRCQVADVKHCPSTPLPPDSSALTLFFYFQRRRFNTYFTRRPLRITRACSDDCCIPRICGDDS